MNWQDIKVSADNKEFIFEGYPAFERKFLEVLKFHSPGIAPVLDASGAYHILSNGVDLYNNRYSRTFGFYCNRASVVSGKYWFHIDVVGQRAYSDSYAWAGNYQENLCVVRDCNNFYFHIDPSGEKIYDSVYLYAGDFKDGVACVKSSDGLFRHIDSNGKLINNASFLGLGIFHKGFATARDCNGWFHIDKSGRELYTKRYAAVEPFYNGSSLVTDFDFQLVVIDEQGNDIINV